MEVARFNVSFHGTSRYVNDCLDHMKLVKTEHGDLCLFSDVEKLLLENELLKGRLSTLTSFEVAW